MNEQWYAVCKDGTLSVGEYAVVEASDHFVAVINVGGQYFAIEDVCTHDGEELTGGPIDDDQIICPRHGARFCIRTGEALSPPAYEPVATFEVRVQDGIIEVKV